MNRDREVVARAHSAVHSAVKCGKLAKPEHCEACGESPGRGRDGRSLLHGHHHEGHENKLSVQWLCVHCHRAATPVNPRKGEACNLAKLTVADVLEIRRSSERNVPLAARYGVTRNAIGRIRAGKDWAWVSENNTLGEES